MKKLLLSLFAVAGFGVFANAETIVETLTVDNFGFTKETTYQDVTYTSTTTGITYAGNACKANAKNGNGLQFRTTSGKEAGLVTTANPNGYTIVSVKVTPSTTAETTNQWDVYGSTQIYSTFKDLYADATKGTLVGSGTTEATVTPTASGLTAFGFRATKAAIYINSIEITYETSGATPDTRKPAGLEFSESKVSVVLGDAFTAPTLSKTTTAAVTYSSDKEEVATVDATTGAVTILAAGSARITATAEANEEYLGGTASYLITVTKPVTTTKVELATAMSDGKFAIACAEGVAKNYTGSNAYGYLFLETIEVVDNAFNCNNDYLITFTNTANGYTMVDCNGKYLGMDATHFGSFNFYDSADAEGSNCYWNIEFTGNDAKITNAGREGAYLSYKKYNNDWEIVTTDNEDMPAIQLYKVANGSAIEEIEAETEAPAVYYNLQGVRVANPENGIFIMVQGKKATKVAL